MAVFLNNKVGVKVNSVDLSDHVTSVSLNRNFDEIEISSMGDTSHKFTKGLEASSITIDFLNDTAAASVLATLQAAWGTTVTVVLLQDKGSAVSATNPLYTMSVLVNGTTDINGSVADIGVQSVTWNCNSTVAVATTGSF
jgi:Flp pilus assembly protein TadG